MICFLVDFLYCFKIEIWKTETNVLYCDFNFDIFGTIQTTVLIVIASLEREYHIGVSGIIPLLQNLLNWHWFSLVQSSVPLSWCRTF